MKNPWRDDFPILKQKAYGRPLVYLDNAATTQVPRQVLDRIVKHYTSEHANVHRGIHFLSSISTKAVEDARAKIASLLHAPSPDTIVFTQGTTDSIHLVCGGLAHLLDEHAGVLVTELEHHSNYVPWQQACLDRGAPFGVCPAEDGVLDLQEMERLLAEGRYILLAIAQVSNLTGTVNPVREITAMAHRYGVRVLVDGAQGILHTGADMKQIDCDYYCFSGHKMLSPTGVGVLYGKKEALEALRPVRFGGGMVDLVTREETTFDQIPRRLEAGTPNISGIIALGAAAEYLRQQDPNHIRRYEAELIAYTEEKLRAVDHLHILGNPAHRAGAVSFTADGIHPYDIAAMTDKLGYAVRSGSHCAQPALRSLGVEHAVRVSPAFYNTPEEIDGFCEALERVIRLIAPPAC